MWPFVIGFFHLIVFPGLIRAVACISTWILFNGWIIPPFVSLSTRFIKPLDFTHPPSFKLLLIILLGTSVLLWTYFSFLFCTYLGMELLGHVVIHVVSAFEELPKLVFQSDCIVILHSHQQCMQVTISLCPHRHSIIRLLEYSHPSGWSGILGTLDLAFPWQLIHL